jgi:hypothetical protein
MKQFVLDAFLGFYTGIKSPGGVQNMFRLGANPNGMNRKGVAYFSYTILFGDKATFEVFLSHPDFDANMNVMEKDYTTALMLAASIGASDIVARLIEKGADVHLEDEDGKTALDMAEAFLTRYKEKHGERYEATIDILKNAANNK